MGGRGEGGRDLYTKTEEWGRDVGERGKRGIDIRERDRDRQTDRDRDRETETERERELELENFIFQRL